MPGKLCPYCYELTLFRTTGMNRKCSKCGYEMIVPPNAGKGGKGKKCAHCGMFTIFNDVCTNCGTRYIKPKNSR